MSVLLFSGVPAPGQPPGHQHGSGWPAPAAAEQCSVLNGPGLLLAFFMSVLLFSGVPAPGRPPGHQQRLFAILR